MRITKSLVDKIEPPDFKIDGKPDQKIYRDSAIIGFGLRITSAGAKSFVVEKRINGKSRRKTLGAYGPLTVEQARNEALKFLGSVATGNDPIKKEKAQLAKNTSLKDTFKYRKHKDPTHRCQFSNSPSTPYSFPINNCNSQQFHPLITNSHVYFQTKIIISQKLTSRCLLAAVKNRKLF